MSAAPAVSLDASTLARLGVLHGTEAMLPARAVLPLDWPELEKTLPDGGLPRGVVELASMHGGTTTIAIAAIRAVHAADERAWCASITPRTEGRAGVSGAKTPSLYAPALAQAGIDLDRLLIVRPEAPALSRTVVKAASSGAFAMVVADVPKGVIQNGNEGVVVTRKLALAAEEYGTTSLLLTNAREPRAMPWPVAMRLEVERRPDALAIRIAKDRRGGGSSHVVRLVS